MKKKFFEYALPIIVAGFTLFLMDFALNIAIKNGIGDFLWQKESLSQTIDFAHYDAAADRTRWKTRIEEVGPEHASKELKTEYSSISDFRIQHTAAHVFGELLYSELGLKGIAFCDSAFNYGCYHAFFGKALATEGLVIFSKVPGMCKDSGKAEANCYHGAGHGLVAFLGYEEKDLARALEECALFPAARTGACDEGVFMEYNFQLMRHGPNIFLGGIRPLEKDPYLPCSSLPQKFGTACYFSQADWWGSVFKGDYKKVGGLCATLTESERAQCFRGVGKKIVWLSPEKTDQAIRICDAMPGYLNSLMCRSGAATAIHGRTGDQNLASRVCDGLNPADTTLCMESLSAYLGN